MSVTKIKSYWESGALFFADVAGNILMKLNPDTARVEMPSNRKVVKTALTAGAANAYAFAWQNPEAAKIIIERIFVRLTTAGGTATAVMDVGVVANATSTADNLIDGLDLNTTGIFDNVDDSGTNGKTRQVVDENGGSNDYITGKILTESASALVGDVYIVYFTV